MKYLNLSSGTDFLFEPALDCEIIRFPSGFETTIRLKNFYPMDRDEIAVVCRVESSGDLFLIAQARDALASCNFHNVSLILPFIPNGRQDRSMVKGDAFGLRVFADFINALAFKAVITLDTHSIVTQTLINNCVNISPTMFQQLILSNETRSYTLVSPDLGAIKKVEETAKSMFKLLPNKGYPEILPCFKKRDPKTGEITGVDAYGRVGEINYILDDICDGGYTFVQVAKLLKQMGAKEVNLVVTHGIFSKGLSPLLNAGISHIYTTNSFDHLQNLFGEDFEARESLQVTDIRPLLKSYL